MRRLQDIFLGLQVEGVFPTGAWEANRERRIGSWEVKKTHIVPEKGLVPDFLLESHHWELRLGSSPAGIKFGSFRGTVCSTQLL